MTGGRAKVLTSLSMACSALVFATACHADEPSAATKRAALVTAAREMYEAKEREFRQFRTVVEDVYVWSRRLMKAEQLHGSNENAAAEHADRMRDLNQFVLELQKKSPERVGSIYLATQYYVLIAELEESRNNSKPDAPSRNTSEAVQK